MKIWKSRTNKGRVVYKRPVHSFTLKDVVRILEKLSNTMTIEQMEQEVYMINALFEIVRTAFYPIAQKVMYPSPNPGYAYFLWDHAEYEIRKMWRDETLKICRLIGEKYGIPGPVIDFVINFLGIHIWNIVWKMSSLFFK